MKLNDLQLGTLRWLTELNEWARQGGNLAKYTTIRRPTLNALMSRGLIERAVMLEGKPRVWHLTRAGRAYLAGVAHGERLARRAARRPS